MGRAIPVSHVFGYWGNLGKLDPNTPNYVQRHMESNPKSSAPCFTSSLGRTIPVSQVLGCWGNLWKLGLNTPNHVEGHMKSNSKSSDPYFTSNETLL